MISLEKLAQYLTMAGFTLVNLDEDETEIDDIAGVFLLYGADASVAIQNNLDLPPVPQVAADMITGKLSPRGRMIIMSMGLTLMFVQMQLAGKNPKAAAVFRYIGQALNSLMASKPVPPVPAVLIAS